MGLFSKKPTPRKYVFLSHYQDYCPLFLPEASVCPPDVEAAVRNILKAEEVPMVDDIKIVMPEQYYDQIVAGVKDGVPIDLMTAIAMYRAAGDKKPVGFTPDPRTLDTFMSKAHTWFAINHHLLIVAIAE